MREVITGMDSSGTCARTRVGDFTARYVGRWSFDLMYDEIFCARTLSAVLTLLAEHGFAYQIEANLDRPLPRGRRQDVRVYAYRD